MEDRPVRPPRWRAWHPRGMRTVQSRRVRAPGAGPRFFLRAALLASIGLCGCSPQYEAGANPCRGQVSGRFVEAIDGDTVDVEILDGDEAGSVERVRLLGVDTPEVNHDDTADSECYGVLGWYESETLADEEVALTFDAECSDTFGRTLAFLWRASDGLFWNEHLLTEGFARTCPREPNSSFDDRFAAAQQGAQANQAGLWAGCDDPASLGECAN